MINRLSNPINRNRSAAKISKVMSSNTYTFQDVQGDDEEAQVILREHVGDDVDVADGLHLLRVVGHDRHVHRQEEENHLLGRS